MLGAGAVIVTGWSAGVALSLWVNAREREARRAAVAAACRASGSTTGECRNIQPPASAPKTPPPPPPPRVERGERVERVEREATREQELRTRERREHDAFDVEGIRIAAEAGAEAARKWRDGERGEELLWIAFDTESTGLDTVHDHITQIAARVVGKGPGDETETFVSYVHTDRKIPKRVTEITGITAATLAHAPSFQLVFHALMGWICSAVVRRGGSVRPVLLAHNGTAFDFPLLLNEMRRHEIPLEVLEVLDIHTADSLALLRAVKADVAVYGDVALALRAHKSLSLPKLFPRIMDRSYAAHDALEDVTALAELVFHSSLSTPLVMDTLRTQFVVAPLEVLHDLVARLARRELRDRLKKTLSSTSIARLVSADVTWANLVHLWNTHGPDGLDAALQASGVHLRDAESQGLVKYFVRTQNQNTNHVRDDNTGGPFKRSISRYSLN